MHTYSHTIYTHVLTLNAERTGGAFECVSKLVNWTPKRGKKKPGRPALNCIDVLKQDIGLHASDMITAMRDRKVWHAIVDRGLHLQAAKQVSLKVKIRQKMAYLC